MKKFVLIMGIFVFLMSMFGISWGVSPVRIESGLVEGIEEDEVIVYRGIPFAKPPVGILRWKAPQKVASWEGILKAEKVRPSCPGRESIRFASLLNEPVEHSEDCLYLNIWTPRMPLDSGKKLPVMVWIHGGGFALGSPNYASYSGENFAKNNIVFVSIAYRLGVFGFLAHPELSKESESNASGNYGIMDQIAGLQWVQDNIEAFGGDKNNVTIFGESAGGISVSILCASQLAGGLFRRAISESGGSFGPVENGERVWGNQSLKAAEETGKNFAIHMGAKSIEELRSIPAEKFVDDASSQMGFFWPICDGYVIADDPVKVYQNGNYNDVDILVGTNSNEGAMFFQSPIKREDYLDYLNIFGSMKNEALAVYPAEDDGQALESRRNIFQDTLFAWPTYTWARLQNAGGKSKVYMYYFNQQEPEHESKFTLKGAAHSDEINYVFGHVTENYNFHYTEEDRKLSEQIMSYWINFARTGNPNGENLPYWPEYAENSDTVMYLNSVQSKPEGLPCKLQMEFLNQYFTQLRLTN